MSEKPSLDQQISAVASDMLSRRGFLDAAERRLMSPKLKDNERQVIELDRMNTLKSQPALEAAVETLRWLKANEEAVREYVASKRSAS
ncbi:hypothetical protein [Microvirga mediterraneensis]|uniref:Uncharacterized protein n=1 Tax=Microvirga mediterraneensis TaxID=2754695 RepID=A0A838BQH5_9HYPH|nr:hypothetical protein [Microvirga mediterraneensis]MBA1157787.1 hypothetical protein [Microvirga mediterraneensis]